MKGLQMKGLQMKRVVFVLIVLTAGLCFFIVAGCKVRGQNTDTLPEAAHLPGPVVADTIKPAAAYSLEEYFPITENTLYKYVGIGSDTLNQEMFNIYTSGKGAQAFVSTGEQRVTDVYRFEDGMLKVIFSSFNYFYDNLLDTVDIKRMTVLQEPLELGQTWVYDSEGAISEVTNLSAKTSVPLGEFETLEITTTHHDLIRRDYYAPGVGLVQTIYDLGNSIISSDLSEIVRNTSKKVEADFCMVNTTLDKLEYEKRPLLLSTNMDFTGTLNSALKEPLPMDYQPLLPGESVIRSLAVNWYEVLLTVDLSEDYVRNLGVGAGTESDILQALANTLGNIYIPGDDLIRNVELLINGNRYESGHILRHEGEYWEVLPVVYHGSESYQPGS